MIVRQVTKPVVVTDETLFLIIGQNSFGSCLFLHNSGQNEITYKFQESDQNIDAQYTDITSGTEPVNGTIQPNDVVLVKITSTKPYIRLRGSSSGGSELRASIMQYSLNVSNVLPILDIQGV